MMRLRQLKIIGSDSSQTSADTSDSLGDRSFDSSSNKSKSPQISSPNKKCNMKHGDTAKGDLHNINDKQDEVNEGYKNQNDNIRQYSITDYTLNRNGDTKQANMPRRPSNNPCKDFVEKIGSPKNHPGTSICRSHPAFTDTQTNERFRNLNHFYEKQNLMSKDIPTESLRQQRRLFLEEMKKKIIKREEIQECETIRCSDDDDDLRNSYFYRHTQNLQPPYKEVKLHDQLLSSALSAKRDATILQDLKSETCEFTLDTTINNTQQLNNYLNTTDDQNEEIIFGSPPQTTLGPFMTDDKRPENVSSEFSKIYPTGYDYDTNAFKRQKTMHSYSDKDDDDLISKLTRNQVEYDSENTELSNHGVNSKNVYEYKDSSYDHITHTEANAAQSIEKPIFLWNTEVKLEDKGMTEAYDGNQRINSVTDRNRRYLPYNLSNLYRNPYTLYKNSHGVDMRETISTIPELQNSSNELILPKSESYIRLPLEINKYDESYMHRNQINLSKSIPMQCNETQKTPGEQRFPSYELKSEKATLHNTRRVNPISSMPSVDRSQDMLSTYRPAKIDQPQADKNNLFVNLTDMREHFPIEKKLKRHFQKVMNRPAYVHKSDSDRSIEKMLSVKYKRF